jgi:hypothetical protein
MSTDAVVNDKAERLQKILKMSTSIDEIYEMRTILYDSDIGYDEMLVINKIIKTTQYEFLSIIDLDIQTNYDFDEVNSNRNYIVPDWLKLQHNKKTIILITGIDNLSKRSLAYKMTRDIESSKTIRGVKLDKDTIVIINVSVDTDDYSNCLKA